MVNNFGFLRHFDTSKEPENGGGNPEYNKWINPPLVMLTEGYTLKNYGPL